jgi:hypothetical protein
MQACKGIWVTDPNRNRPKRGHEAVGRFRQSAIRRKAAKGKKKKKDVFEK